MRKPVFRSPSQTDYGLPPHRPRHDIREAGDTLLATLLGPPRRAAVRRRLRGQSGLHLSLGSGACVPPGWVGFDTRPNPPNVLRCDLRRGLPIGDDTVAAVLAEHVLEHLFLDDVERIVDECRRVLRRGAPVRIVSPDVAFLARMVTQPEAVDVAAQVAYDAEIHRWADDRLRHWRAVNRLSHQWGAHRSLLGVDLLREMLQRAGFTEIDACRPQETRHFDVVPGTHAERFRGPDDEAFAIEALA